MYEVSLYFIAPPNTKVRNNSRTYIIWWNAEGNALSFLCIGKFAISFFPEKHDGSRSCPTQPRASRILCAISASSSPFHLHFLFSSLFFFTARNYARNKRKALVDKSVPIKGNPFYYMQFRTLIQGCHELSREETFKIRARVVVLVRSRGRNQHIF